MGQAKQRGTFEQRKAQAIARMAQPIATRQEPKPVIHDGQYRRKRPMAASTIGLAALAMAVSARK